ncbi:hypothetical protein [Cupriavidus agavae]|uniref:Type II secretion system protein n=1 Tax=Cupriavidus agavae TaxID=1001822 RepID=A0A4Q7S4N1_9BURK|nr:hypothetical protein [Cupriavidus agavae]RZT41391.1 hypothetical protein EV147_0380 [Cupriavidus agavae]
MSPTSLCLPPLTRRSRRAGFTLFESLLCTALVGLAMVPLATLAAGWLRWSGEHERWIGTLRLAAERAEVGAGVGTAGWPLVSGDASRVALCEAATPVRGCLPGMRLAVATLPAEAAPRIASGAVLPTRIALWVSP